MSVSGPGVDPSTTLDAEKVLESFNQTSASTSSANLSAGSVDNILSAALSAQEYIDNCKYLLEYERQMFLDMCHSDGLLIAAKGISYDEVVVNLLKVYGDPSNLVLVINCSAIEEELYKSQLDAKLVHEVANTATARERIYLEGGIQFVSTRILVVDLLKGRVPTDLVTGIIVLRAHNVIESCQEAFALRLFRRKNGTGFIKAFSRSAEHFTYNFGHVEKVMRNMFLRELYIWPRFHALIQGTLKPYEPRVTEFHVPMTPKMAQLQSNVMDIMNYLVKELKRLNPRLDMGEITVENTLTKNYHKILQAQLDSVWHQLSGQTKLIISDLKVLRSIMVSVIYNDSVGLYSLLRQYRKTEYAINNSGWVLLDACEQLFTVSRARLFNDKEEFDPEWCPKWKPLIELLRVEIPSDLKRRGVPPGGVGVLILCNDARTCSQLNQYLTMGAEKYLFHEALRNGIQVHKLGADFKKMTATAEFGHYQIQEKEKQQHQQQVQQQRRAKARKRLSSRVLKAESIEFGEAGEGEGEQDGSQGGSSATVKNPLLLGEGSLIGDKDDGMEDCSAHDSYVLTMSQADDSTEYTMSQSMDFDSSQYSEFSAVLKSSLQAPQPTICIQTFKTMAMGSLALDRVLKDLNPSYVIMYHTDVTAIRQLEVFEARLRRPPAHRMNVFVLLHADTAEEQAYLTALRREKQAFELIVNTKRTMVVETDREGRLLSEPEAQEREKDPQKDANAVSRQAGGQEKASSSSGVVAMKKPQVVTDMREFRSELPCLIHRRGVEVVPVTLTIGDYILTPDICVERKSISDLIGSLNSGRLYNQAVQMQRYYKKPVLLIEFDQNKPFHLQGRYMMSDTSHNMDVVKKLQLLTLHFPKLMLVWSASPYATAQLFSELKAGKAEPDADAAAALGTEESAELTETYNPVMYDFLLRLPGINTRNVVNVLKRGKSLKELLKLGVDELVPILGSRVNAQLLHGSLHESYKPVPEEASARPKHLMNKFRKFRK